LKTNLAVFKEKISFLGLPPKCQRMLFMLFFSEFESEFQTSINANTDFEKAFLQKK